MRRITDPGGVEYLQFENLSSHDRLVHAFSTKIGGVSKSYFSSMNLGFNRGDANENVTENYRRFCSAIGIEPDALVFSSQTHSTIIRRAGRSELGSGSVRKALRSSCDGLATDEPGVFLATLYADCVPLYFYDPVKNAVALSHAGWRGTLNDMAGTTVRFMVREFDSCPADIIMGIGPSIGRCCFEVGKDVSELFLRLPEETISGAVSDHIDLQLLNRRSAMKSGVPDHNIETADICTKCNSEWLFSHRATKGKRGSLCAVIGIKDRL